MTIEQDKCRAEFEIWAMEILWPTGTRQIAERGYRAAWQAQEARIAKLREALEEAREIISCDLGTEIASIENALAEEGK